MIRKVVMGAPVIVPITRTEKNTDDPGEMAARSGSSLLAALHRNVCDAPNSTRKAVSPENEASWVSAAVPELLMFVKDAGLGLWTTLRPAGTVAYSLT
jgi:hypothetical protein